MTAVRVQGSAALRIRVIRDREADSYITFDAFRRWWPHVRSPPSSAWMAGYEKHFVYWKWLSNGDIGIVTVLHERMHQFGRFLDDYGE